MDSSDSELLLRHRSGDREAFDVIVLRYGYRVLAYARKWLDRDDALDVVQETFIQLMDEVKQCPPPAPGYTVLAFIFSIAYSRVRDHLKATARYRLVLLELAAEGIENARPTDEIVIGIEEAAALSAEIDALPEVYREITWMHLTGYSCAELARRFNITATAARQRCARGEAMLRARLKGGSDGPASTR